MPYGSSDISKGHLCKHFGYVYMPVQYNEDKSEKLRQIKGLSDLSLFFFHLFSMKKSAQNKGAKREMLH